MKNSTIVLVLILFLVIFLVINFLLNFLFPSWNVHWASSIGGAVGLWGIWLYQNRKKVRKEK